MLGQMELKAGPYAVAQCTDEILFRGSLASPLSSERHAVTQDWLREALWSLREAGVLEAWNLVWHMKSLMPLPDSPDSLLSCTVCLPRETNAQLQATPMQLLPVRALFEEDTMQ